MRTTSARLTWVALVSAFCLLGGSASLTTLRAQASADQTSIEDQQLKKAQTDYYQDQTEKLRSKSLADSLSDNPGSALAATAAFLAALIALTSLIVNRRVTLRNQKDTQFYEALKRFGDKDSAVLRSNLSPVASGGLANLIQRPTDKHQGPS